MDVENYELTNPQKSILLTEQFHENTSVSNVCGLLTIHTKIDADALEKAINLFIQNNDSMRINLFANDTNIRQHVKEYNFVNIEKIKITEDYSLTQLKEDIITKHFTLLNSDLYTFTIFINQDGTGGFIGNFHHIISDAWTMSYATDSIMSYYSSIIDNTPVESNNNSYIDYIHTEQEYMNSPKFEKSKAFWENQYENLEFSYLKDFQSNSYEAERKEFNLSKEQTEKLTEFCAKNKTSLFSLFMATVTIYLSKINHTSSATVGTPILNRTNAKEKKTTGMYISTVPFHVNIDKNLKCIDFINAVTKQEFSILRNQRYPYNLLLDSIRKKFNISKNLYDVCVSYQNARAHQNDLSIPYTCDWVFNHCVVNNLDIHLYDFDGTGAITLYYDFKTALFTPEDIDLLHNRLMHMIDQIISNPELELGNLDIISKKEEYFILTDYNKPCKKAHKFISVYDLFKIQLNNFYDKLAIKQGEVSLTYTELNNLANLIALDLKNKYDIKHGDVLCLAFNDSIEFVASVLATQKLGACYIPIDINYPNERIEYIVKNSNSKLILTFPKSLKSTKIEKDIIYRINLDNYRYTEENIVDLNYDLKEDDIAYIIYTSGSTGNPKGVKICHKSLFNYIFWAIKQYVHGEETNFPLFSSIAFDLTVTSIYTPLCSGNSIYIYQNENPQLLLKQIVEDKDVQIIKLTPGHFSLLQDIDLSDSNITKFILGGDILTKEICEKISSMFPHQIHIYNEYGPTEATVGCMIYEYNQSDKYVSVPIGYPIDNTQIYILNDELELSPLGVVGEMYISGDCLALGYTDENKTSEKFIENPFDNGKLYKTGDLAKLHNDGIMEYLGRSDFQVKLNGYRIELGEIQSVLLTHPLIKDTYVSLIDNDDHKFLCAYYVAESEIDDLSTFLKNMLPNYMIPNHFIRLDKIPLTINGKVDKKSLPLPKKQSNKYVKPSNKLEKTLQDVFMQLTKNRISVEDNIFDYYMDSLELIKAQSILYGEGISVNTQYFYEYPTIRKLSEFLLNENSKNISGFLVDIPEIKSVKTPIKKSTEDFKKVILFGATGFLGMHILYNLIKTSHCKIFCVVRKKHSKDPLNRLIDKFNFYFPDLDLNKYLYRIKIVEGDILEKRLGLSQELYEHLGNQCDCVIDTAALVKHYGDYDLFNKTNVNSTKKIIEFCETFNIPLHYISSMSVSGYGLVKTPSSDFTENDLYIGQNFTDNVYVRSKFEAEQAIIKHCATKNLIASIYRLGTITNRYIDGKFQENYDSNAFLNRLDAFITLHAFPKELLNFQFEFTPVDICANFVVQLMKQQSKNLEIYHLYNENYVTSIELINIIRKYGIDIDIIPLQDFQNMLANSKSNYFGITAYFENINNITFHNEKTNEVLSSINLKWPEITKKYINKVLKYIQNKN